MPGRCFLRHVQETERAHAKVLAQLQSPLGDLSGRFPPGQQYDLHCLVLFARRASAFSKNKHAAVTCDVMEGNTDFIVGQLLDQRIELGLVGRTLSAA